MTFSCNKCGSLGFRKVQGKRFCNKCPSEPNSGAEILMKEEMMFGPQEIDQPFLNEQDSHDVDMEKGTTNTMQAPNPFQQEGTPRYCYHCGNELAFINSSHQVNFCHQCGVQQMRRTSSHSSSFGTNGPDYVLQHEEMNIPHVGQLPCSNSLTRFGGSFENTPPQYPGFSPPPNLPMSSSQDFSSNNSSFAINNFGEQMNSPHQSSSVVQQMQMRTHSSSSALIESGYDLQQSISIPYTGGKTTDFSNSFQNIVPQHAVFSGTPPVNQPMPLHQDFRNNNQFANNIPEPINSPSQRQSFSGTPYERPNIGTSSPRLIPSRKSSFSTSFSHGSSIGLKHLFTSQPSSADKQLDTSSNQGTFNQQSPIVVMETNSGNQLRDFKVEPQFNFDNISGSIEANPAANYAGQVSVFQSEDLQMNQSEYPRYVDPYSSMFIQPNGQNMGLNDNNQTTFHEFGQNVNVNTPAYFNAPGMVPFEQSMGLNSDNPNMSQMLAGQYVKPNGNNLTLSQLLGQEMESEDNKQTLPRVLEQSVALDYSGQTSLQPFEQNMVPNATNEFLVQTQEINLVSLSSNQTLSQLLGESVDLGCNIPAHSTGNAGRVVTIETDEYGDTILHQHIQQNKTNEALLELRRLDDIYANEKETFLEYVNKRNERGKVALQSAIKNQNVEIIENLLEHGVDVTILDHDGNNIFHLIVLTSSTEEMVLRLLRGVFKYHLMYQNKFGALFNDESKAFNNEGFAVVHEVSTRSFGDTLKFFKENGANLNIVGRKEKKTAMLLAAKSRNWHIVELLCTLGACVNIPTTSCWYPVHAAIEDKDVERLKFFMNNGVDIYGYTKIETTEEIIDMCDKYMRKRRRKSKGDKGGSSGGGARKRRCKCMSDCSLVH